MLPQNINSVVAPEEGGARCNITTDCNYRSHLMHAKKAKTLAPAVKKIVAEARIC